MVIHDDPLRPLYSLISHVWMYRVNSSIRIPVRCPHLDTVLLGVPRFMHRMQFFPFSFKQLRDLDSVQRSVHLHSLQLSASTARSALLVTSNFVSVSDKADISMAASLVGMLGSRMLEHMTVRVLPVPVVRCNARKKLQLVASSAKRVLRYRHRQNRYATAASASARPINRRTCQRLL